LFAEDTSVIFSCSLKRSQKIDSLLNISLTTNFVDQKPFKSYIKMETWKYYL